MRSRGQGWNKTEKFSSKRKDSRKKCERLRKLKEFFPEIYDTIMTERFVLLETTENKKGAEGMKKIKADSNLGNNGKPADGQYFSACLCGNNLCGYQHGDVVGL